MTKKRTILSRLFGTDTQDAQQDKKKLKNSSSEHFKEKLDEVKHEHLQHDKEHHEATHDKKNHLGHHGDDYRRNAMSNSHDEKLSRGAQFINKIKSWAQGNSWRRG